MEPMNTDATKANQVRPRPLHHPVVVEHAARRAGNLQLHPWPRLTLVVSLEAIFLSTFVMIGQNRQAEFQQAKADHDYMTEGQELQLNTELTRAVHDLTLEIHRRVVLDRGGQPDPTGAP